MGLTFPSPQIFAAGVFPQVGIKINLDRGHHGVQAQLILQLEEKQRTLAVEFAAVARDIYSCDVLKQTLDARVRASPNSTSTITGPGP